MDVSIPMLSHFPRPIPDNGVFFLEVIDQVLPVHKILRCSSLVGLPCRINATFVLARQ